MLKEFGKASAKAQAEVSVETIISDFCLRFREPELAMEPDDLLKMFYREQTMHIWMKLAQKTELLTRL